MKHITTTFSKKALLAATALTCGLIAAACDRDADASASVSPEEGTAVAYAGDEPLVDAEQAYTQDAEIAGPMGVEFEAQGPGEAELMGPQFEAQGPQYEEIELYLDPTIASACGLDGQPKVYFDFDSAKVRSDSEQKIRKIGQCLQEYPLADAKLTVTGHADPRGPEEYNRELGLDRANAIGRILRQTGVSAARIDTYSRGELEAGENPGDFERDRRVIIKLDH